MKKFLFMIFLLISSASSTVFAGENTAISINGKTLEPREIYTDSSQRALMPIRWFSEQFGYSLSWDESAKTAVLSQGSDNLYLKSGEDVIQTEKGTVKMDTEIQIIGDRMFIPVRGFAECLDMKVRWNQDTKTICLINPDYILYEDEQLGIDILVPEGYSKDDYSIEKADYENYSVLNFFTAKNNQLLFSLSFFDLNYWNEEVKDNFPVIYSELYKDNSRVVLCVNVTDVQYPPDDEEQKQAYTRLLDSKENICSSICYFTD